MSATDTVDLVRHQWARAMPDLDTAALGVTHRITALATRINGDAERIFGRLGVSGPVFDVLAALYAAGPGRQLSPTQLSMGRLVSSGGMTARLDLAEAAGFLVRARAQHDRRGVTVTLLDPGVRVVRQGVAALLAEESPLSSVLTLDDGEVLTRLLARLLQPPSDRASEPSVPSSESLISSWVRAFPDHDPWLVHFLGAIPLLSTQVDRESRKAVGTLGLTPNAFGLLCALRRAGAPYRLSPTELYEVVVLSPAGVTGQLEKLARAGLIERSLDSQDKRMKHASLTRAGLKLVNQTIGDFVMRHDWLLKPLSPGERTHLAELLHKILASVESRPEHEAKSS